MRRIGNAHTIAVLAAILVSMNRRFTNEKTLAWCNNAGRGCAATGRRMGVCCTNK